jgi:hypothetical protein
VTAQRRLYYDSAVTPPPVAPEAALPRAAGRPHARLPPACRALAATGRRPALPRSRLGGGQWRPVGRDRLGPGLGVAEGAQHVTMSRRPPHRSCPAAAAPPPPTPPPMTRLVPLWATPLLSRASVGGGNDGGGGEDGRHALPCRAERDRAGDGGPLTEGAFSLLHRVVAPSATMRWSALADGACDGGNHPPPAAGRRGILGS